MPVHDALPFLDAAVESILAQTFADFEFVILDDASTDGSRERLHQWAEKDSRIRLLEAKRQLGPALSSQRVATAATAPLVARMDADDVSLPDRLREQVAAFEAMPNAAVVGTLCDFIDVHGRRLRGPEPWRLVRRSPLVPFAHGATMYRRAVFDRAGGYRRESEYWEDQDLVARMAELAPVYVVPKALYRVRLTATSTRAASSADALEVAVDRMYRSMDPRGGEHRDRPGVDPRVFISLGSQQLWSGNRPRLFRRLLRRGNLGANFKTASALVWTAWASASPETLRGFLRALLFVRNAHAAMIHKGKDPVRWANRRNQTQAHSIAGPDNPTRPSQALKTGR